MLQQSSRLHRFTRYSALAMAFAGLIATLIAFASDYHWYADLFSHLRPQYCLWLGLALVAAILLRHRWAIVVALCGLLANAVALFPFARPWPSAPEGAAAGRPWTFVSLNLLHGNRNTAAVTDYLRQVQADVVVFQEVSPRWAGELETLRDLYPYRAVRSRKDSFGLAVFSRIAPVELQFRVVGNRTCDLAAFAAWESEGRKIQLVGMHPDKPDEKWKTEIRRGYFESVERWCLDRQKAKEPLIVLGDFNATPWSSSMRSFVARTKLRNVNQGTIFAASWNVWQPHRLLIDHALISSEWKLQEHQIGPAVGSDHRPLLVRAVLDARPIIAE